MRVRHAELKLIRTLQQPPLGCHASAAAVVAALASAFAALSVAAVVTDTHNDTHRCRRHQRSCTLTPAGSGCTLAAGTQLAHAELAQQVQQSC